MTAAATAAAWVGTLVRSRIDLHTTAGTHFPAGSVFRVTGHWRGKVHLHRLGSQLKIRHVDVAALEPYRRPDPFAVVHAPDPEYPSLPVCGQRAGQVGDAGTSTCSQAPCRAARLKAQGKPLHEVEIPNLTRT